MLFAALGGNFGQNSRVQQAAIIDNTPDGSRLDQSNWFVLVRNEFFLQQELIQRGVNV